jgi:hypothetical protein
MFRTNKAYGFHSDYAYAVVSAMKIVRDHLVDQHGMTTQEADEAMARIAEKRLAF